MLEGQGPLPGHQQWQQVQHLIVRQASADSSHHLEYINETRWVILLGHPLEHDVRHTGERGSVDSLALQPGEQLLYQLHLFLHLGLKQLHLTKLVFQLFVVNRRSLHHELPQDFQLSLLC